MPEQPQIRVVLSDGASRTYPKGIRPSGMAESIGPRLSRDALACDVDGELLDPGRTLDVDASVRVHSSRDAEAFEVPRHSTARLTAHAVKYLLPQAQIGIGPVTDRALPCARECAAEMTGRGFRVQIDGRGEKIRARIREARMQKVPYMLIIGDREVEARTVPVRSRTEGETGAFPLGEFISILDEEVSTKRLSPQGARTPEDIRRKGISPSS
jgi:threonyl-tRNA synthetase